MRNQNTGTTKTLNGATRTVPKSRTLQLAFASLATIVSLLCLTTSNAYSAIITSRSCSPADIQTAVNSASTGDVVQLPACTNSSWIGVVNISKEITIAGAGETQTKLIKPGTDTRAMFVVNCSGGLRGFEFYGITLGGRGDETTLDKGMWLRNGCQDFTVHNTTFQKFGHAGIYTETAEGPTTGVVYECNFLNNFRPQRGYGLEVVGDGTYPETLELGTQNALFVEDSYFEGNRHAIASNNGARYVFRYNEIVDNRENASAIDAHGKTPYWPRGSRAYEIYNNNIVNSIDRWQGVGIRGGDGVIFNNTISGTIYAIALENDSNYTGCSYPCPDQIRELHIWNNTEEGRTAEVTPLRENNARLIQEGRDYFLFPRPGYTPYPYPHPLRVQFGDSTPPAAPSGLTILP